MSTVWPEGCKWREGTTETEVRLGGWCEGGRENRGVTAEAARWNKRDAVGINCEKGATTENQGGYVRYMG